MGIGLLSLDHVRVCICSRWRREEREREREAAGSGDNLADLEAVGSLSGDQIFSAIFLFLAQEILRCFSCEFQFEIGDFLGDCVAALILSFRSISSFFLCRERQSGWRRPFPPSVVLAMHFWSIFPV